MAGHGSPPPEDKANHPARQVGRLPYGQGGPHPSLSDEQVERIRQQTAVNAQRRQYDPDTIEEGRRLNQEVDRYGEYRD